METTDEDIEESEERQRVQPKCDLWKTISIVVDRNNKKAKIRYLPDIMEAIQKKSTITKLCPAGKLSM